MLTAAVVSLTSLSRVLLLATLLVDSGSAVSHELDYTRSCRKVALDVLHDPLEVMLTLDQVPERVALLGPIELSGQHLVDCYHHKYLLA